MRAVYDFTVSPPQWDFSTALVNMEIARIAAGEAELDILFRPGPRDGFRGNEAWPPTTAERRLLMDRIVLPLCGLLPSVRSANWWRGRSGEISGLYGFGARLYGVAQCMTALRSPHGRPLVAPRVDTDPELVTITLREAEHAPGRNSDVPEWVEAARRLQAEGLKVVAIRDTRLQDVPLAGVPIDPLAAVDLNVRAALYARAAVNCCVQNGPQALLLYANLPLLSFKPINPAAPLQTVDYLTRHGLPQGSQYPNSPPWQRIVWDDDRADVIVREVLCEMRTRSAASAPAPSPESAPAPARRPGQAL